MVKLRDIIKGTTISLGMLLTPFLGSGEAIAENITPSSNTKKIHIANVPSIDLDTILSEDRFSNNSLSDYAQDGTYTLTELTTIEKGDLVGKKVGVKKYNQPGTIYSFPDGSALSGSEMQKQKLWTRVPLGTKVFLAKDERLEELKNLESKDLHEYLMCDLGVLSKKKKDLVSVGDMLSEYSADSIKIVFEKLDTDDEQLAEQVKWAYFNKVPYDAVSKALTKKKGIRKDFYQYRTAFKRFDLSLDQYNEVMEACMSKEICTLGHAKRFGGVLKILEHEELINAVSEHYDIHPQTMWYVFNQESKLEIGLRGAHGESGLGHFKKRFADSMARKVSEKGNSLHFKGFNIEKYSFESENGKLGLDANYVNNIILQAASIRETLDNIDNYCVRNDISKRKVFKMAKHIGSTFDFTKIAGHGVRHSLNDMLSEIVADYKVSDEKNKDIKNLWKNMSDDDSNDFMFYLVHNGGYGSFKSVLRNQGLSKVLIYHMSSFMLNRDDLDLVMDLHYDGIDDMLESSSRQIKNMPAGSKEKFWGNVFQKIDKDKVLGFETKGLMSIPRDALDTMTGSDSLQVVETDSGIFYVDDSFKTHRPKSGSFINMASMINSGAVDDMYQRLNDLERLEDAQEGINALYKIKEKTNEDWAKVKNLGEIVRETKDSLGMSNGFMGIKKIRSKRADMEKHLESKGFIPDTDRYFKPMSENSSDNSLVESEESHYLRHLQNTGNLDYLME